MSDTFADPAEKYNYDEETGTFMRKNPEPIKKLNVLYWGDTPTCSTGFGQVARNVLQSLNATGNYDFNILGINHGGDYYDFNKFPYKIDPATCLLSNDTDLHGRPKLLRKLRTERVDILFIIQDTFLMMSVMDDIIKIRKELPLDRQFVIIYYFPIDGNPQPDWITKGVLPVDFPVTYTQYAKQACYKTSNQMFPLDVIYHGVNKQEFFPLNDETIKEFRKKVFGVHADKFLVLNVNRNQQRKDLHRSLAAYSIFHKKHADSFYFINCQMEDIGGRLDIIGSQYGLKMPDPKNNIEGDWTFPAPGTFSAAQGYSIDVLNSLYNAADLVISSTLGEGWGLSCTEAMQCKTPVLFPRNTSLIEMIGPSEERGFLCKSGEDRDHMICLGGIDNNVIRPVINVQDMADKISYIYEHPEEAKNKANEAFAWVKSWYDISPKWFDVFKRAESKLKEMRGAVQE